MAEHGKIPRLQLPDDLIRLADNLLAVMTNAAKKNLPETLTALEARIDSFKRKGSRLVLHYFKF
jgi:hypothetical protein